MRVLPVTVAVRLGDAGQQHLTGLGSVVRLLLPVGPPSCRMTVQYFARDARGWCTWRLRLDAEGLGTAGLVNLQALGC